jgi:hypothetical protein
MPSEDRLDRTSHRGRRLSRSDHNDPLVLAQVVVTTAGPQPIAVSPNTPLQGASGMSASQGFSQHVPQEGADARSGNPDQHEWAAEEREWTGRL